MGHFSSPPDVWKARGTVDEDLGLADQEGENGPNIPLQEKSQGDFTGPQEYF